MKSGELRKCTGYTKKRKEKFLEIFGVRNMWTKYLNSDIYYNKEQTGDAHVRESCMQERTAGAVRIGLEEMPWETSDTVLRTVSPPALTE